MTPKQWKKTLRYNIILPRSCSKQILKSTFGVGDKYKTPKGIFKSIDDVAKAYNTTYSKIYVKFKSKKEKEFNIVDHDAVI